MKKYIFKRLVHSLVIFIGVSILLFTIIQLQPGNPYLNKINPNTPKEKVEEILIKKGYYDPIYIKYFKWVKDALKFDLGYSIEYGKPVVEVIKSRLPNTLILSIPALILSLIISIPLGIYTAYRHDSIFDKIINIFSLIGISIPTFFFGILLIKVFAFDLKLFPISGMKGFSGGGVGETIHHMVLPLTVLTYLNVCSLTRYIKTAMMAELDKDYIKTAVGKGLSYRQAIRVHGLRNILNPIITITTMQLPGLFSGALVTESIFIWPGIGKLNFDAALYRDYPLIMGLLILTVAVVLISNLIADILYVVVDKRIDLY